MASQISLVDSSSKEESGSSNSSVSESGEADDEDANSQESIGSDEPSYLDRDIV